MRPMATECDWCLATAPSYSVLPNSLSRAPLSTRKLRGSGRIVIFVYLPRFTNLQFLSSLL